MSRMPVLFVGHGSPMNAIEDNEYSRAWRKIGERMPRPEAIISISAHWYTHGTRIMNDENPRTIYDMYRFPKELYQVTYDAAGAPAIANAAKQLISRETKFDNTWGLDHGTWSVLVHIFPKRDVPVFQISIDVNAPAEDHYKIGKELSVLREKGVLIFGSGNIVHNLMLVDWHKANKGFDWAYDFDEYIYKNIMGKNHENILKFNELGTIAKLAVPTPDHFYPLLYALGASNENDTVSVYNKSCELGSLTMTSYIWE